MALLDRLLGRPEAKAAKAVSGPGVAAYYNGTPLSAVGITIQNRMAMYLAAYKVGWFYKAESKISRDIAGLKRFVAPEDAEGDNAEPIVAADLRVPFDNLAPIEQFLRLMERPNPFQTGRDLFQRTQIRIDMAGAAFWYLAGATRADLPQAIYGISPARMWPAYDERGTLVGWILDKDAPSGGTPFSTDEILPFVLPGTDDGYNPVGVVEAVYAEVPLTDRMAQHTADVLATGGRLAGMMWPKERRLSEDEFQDALRAHRNVVDRGDAARRLVLYPEPMEYAQGAASPAEIGIPELATLNRDNILTAFPVNPYMLGVPMPGGFNSAEIRRAEEKAYQRHTIHPRVEFLEEVIQTGLLARYEAVLGTTLDFEIEEPNLDDAPALIEKAGALQALLTLGFDPKASVEAVGLDHIAFNGMVVNAPEGDGTRVVVRDATQQDGIATQENIVGGKALDEPLADIIRPDATKAARREDVVGLEVPGSEAALRDFLRDQRSRTIAKLEEVLPRTKAGRKALPEGWWDAEAEDALLEVTLRDAYKRTSRGALQVVADTMERLVTRDRIGRVIEANLKAAGDRIHGINEATRQAIADVLTEGVRRGYSIPQLTLGVPDEKFPGVANAPMQNGLSAFDDYRAEVIARTETMNAYNDAAIRGYSEFGVAEVQAVDGDKDEACANRDGRTFPVDDALGIADHPNGTLDWIPVIGGGKSVDVKDQPTTIVNINVADSISEHLADVVKSLTDRPLVPPIVNVTVPEQPAPVVNVLTPKPVVNVEAPVVKVTTPKGSDVQDVRIVDSTLPPRKRKVKRDPQGRITEMVDE